MLGALRSWFSLLVRVCVATVLMSLVFCGASMAAGTVTLHGRTSQRSTIVIVLRGGRVVKARVTFTAACDNGERIKRTVTVGGGPLNRGRFTLASGAAGARYVLVGRVGGHSASGQLRALLLFALSGRVSRSGPVLCDSGGRPRLVSWSAGRSRARHASDSGGSGQRRASIARGLVYRAGCLEENPSGYDEAASARESGDRFSIEAPSDGSADFTATSLARPMQTAFLPSYRLWFRDSRGDGRLLMPHSIAGFPYSFPVIVAASDGGLPSYAAGITEQLCDFHSEANGIAIDANYALDGWSTPLHILAHELAHGFQSGLLGTRVPGNWFSEATAEYFGALLAPDPIAGPRLDALFFQQPDVPLDNYALADLHEYGAYRFIEFVAAQMGSATDVYSFLRAVIQRTGPGVTPSPVITDTLAQELAARGQSFADDLGRFWGEHLLDPADRAAGAPGPRVEQAAINATSGDQTLSANRLAAGFGTFGLSGDTQRVTFTTPDAGPDGRVWVAYNHQIHDWSSGGTATFCVGETTSGALPWPGEFRIVYVNTAIRGTTSSLTLHLETSSDPCVPGHPGPGSGSDAYPQLGSSCPPTPMAPVGAGQNADWVFLYLFDQVFTDMTNWGVGAFFTSPHHRLPLWDGERRFRRVLLCTAQRAAGIPPSNGSVSTQRGRFITDLYSEASYLQRAINSSGRRRTNAAARAATFGTDAVTRWEAIGTLTSASACNNWRTVNRQDIGCGAVTNG